MFYSETLLSKTGPLARVWLSANLERKLSKSHILQSNIESSVHAIVDQGQAPMALRLSGQLLLGVVRIYSRKARYLLDDCNEALMKIKLAFRPGNVDLPPNQSHTANPASLILPDVLTELDLLAPVPDPALLLSPAPDYDFPGGRDPTLLDWGSSQVLPASIEQPLGEADEGLYLDGDDLGLDISDTVAPPPARESSIEVGRRESVHRPIAEEMDDSMRMYEHDDLGLDIGEPDNVNGPTVPAEPQFDDDFNPIQDDEVNMGGMDDSGVGLAEEQAPMAAPTSGRRDRESLSPLSSLRSSVEREVERSYHQNRESTIYEPEEVTVHQARQAKRRKILQADADTEIHSNQIRAQQNDRSKILKPPSFLPRDPMLLALMNMQKNGGFVSNILGDGRSAGWAPELRGILSLEIVRKSADLKRKRDSGVADLEDEEAQQAEAQAQDERQPHLEIDQSLELDIPMGNLNVGGDATLSDDIQAHEEILELPPAEDDGIHIPPMDDEDQLHENAARPRSRSRALTEEDDGIQPPIDDTFDDTTLPTVDPADSGPVSQGTKHAVHLLRERFGTESQNTPSKRHKASVLFQDLLPEATTSRTDATKMFFEVLVLATKDAIKVEQEGQTEEGRLDAPIRLRAKRGLWGRWAEMDAGGEIEGQEQESGSMGAVA